MNAEILHIISVVAFILSGVFFAVAVVIFFKLNIRGVIDDVSGRKAERQIKELREMNRQVGEQGNALYRHSVGSVLHQSESRNEKNVASSMTEKLPKEDMETILLQDAGGTVLLEEETSLLKEKGTTLLAEEKNVLFGEETILTGGYRLVFNEIVIYTEERI